MTPEELVEALAPIRLPPEVARFGPMDALIAFALGLLLALLLRAVLPSLTARKASPEAQARRALAAASQLPADERLFRLAHLLRQLDPDDQIPRPAGLSAQLYDPAHAPDTAPLEAAILAAARRKERGA
ncbi:hypothetical protein [Poseidonocella sedimentorum]|uniref:Uncharacterized protein n=1 Tax=Poseidonocella sedimentorum TaxID=871652 RepID=A0A1I6E4E4_9RHOB|nr:hypothetical protein [Poseidonocella sedimentorum]SFR12348.1 hypothetical protein SAMN04515673_10751 [Poseidonocella sedimentorum]